MKEALEKILERELCRINEASLVGPLDIEDCKKLEILTRSLKQLEVKKEKEANPFDGVSTEDIINFIRDSHEQHNTEPRFKGPPEGVPNNDKENCDGRVVEEGGSTRVSS